MTTAGTTKSPAEPALRAERLPHSPWLRSLAVALLAVLPLPLLGGCSDIAFWRVQQPAAVALHRGSRLGDMHPTEELLPADDAPRAVTVPYVYRPPRHQMHPASYCVNGPAWGAKTLSGLTGLAFACQGMAVARRGAEGALDLELQGETKHLVTADGTVPYQLVRSGYDPQTETVWARLAPQFLPGRTTGLDLLLVTPRTNLAAAVRVRRREPMIGGLLLGFSPLYALAGVAALVLKANNPDWPTIPLVAPAVFALGVSAATLGTGTWLLTRSEKAVPLFPN